MSIFNHPEKPPQVHHFLPNPANSNSAMVRIDFHLKIPAFSNETEDAKLRIHAVDTDLSTVSVPLHIDAQELKFWIVVNSHYLPNGKNSIQFEMHDDQGESFYTGKVELNIQNSGSLAQAVAASLKEHNTPWAFNGVCDARDFDYSNRSLFPWFNLENASLHLDEQFDQDKINHEERESLQYFVEHGYIILPHPIEDSLLESIDKDLDQAVAEGYQGYEYGSSQRLEGLHQRSDAIRSLWTHPMIIHYLSLIFGVPVRPCQTLTYIFGSQQDYHQDTVHLTPFPAGYMCGVWVAIEDVKPGSGELSVVPGSHRFPAIYNHTVDCAKMENGDFSEFGIKVVGRWQEMLEESKLEEVPYIAKRGQVLIWHENLLHCGKPRTEHSQSRRSIVSHYFADGAIAYYDSTGLPGVLSDRVQ